MQWTSFAPDGARSEDAPVGANEDVLRTGEDAPVGANEDVLRTGEDAPSALMKCPAHAGREKKRKKKRQWHLKIAASLGSAPRVSCHAPRA